MGTCLIHQKSTVSDARKVRGAPRLRNPRVAVAQYALSARFSTLKRAVSGVLPQLKTYRAPRSKRVQAGISSALFAVTYCADVESAKRDTANQQK